MKLSNYDFTQLVKWCRRHGHSIRMHTHPKTRANWDSTYPSEIKKREEMLEELQGIHPVLGTANLPRRSW